MLSVSSNDSNKEVLSGLPMIDVRPWLSGLGFYEDHFKMYLGLGILRGICGVQGLGFKAEGGGEFRLLERVFKGSIGFRQHFGHLRVLGFMGPISKDVFPECCQRFHRSLLTGCRVWSPGAHSGLCIRRYTSGTLIHRASGMCFKQRCKTHVMANPVIRLCIAKGVRMRAAAA